MHTFTATATGTPARTLNPGDFVEVFPRQQNFQGLRINSGVKTITTVPDAFRIKGQRGSHVDGVRVTFLNGTAILVPIDATVTARRKMNETATATRSESESCQKGTPGCSVDHDTLITACETW